MTIHIHFYYKILVIIKSLIFYFLLYDETLTTLHTNCHKDLCYWEKCYITEQTMKISDYNDNTPFRAEFRSHIIYQINYP
jgi:hypothetical protein